MHSNLTVIDVPLKGEGIFAKGDIQPKSIILEFKGEVFTTATLPDYFLKHNLYLQIGTDTFLGASGWVDDIVNHSCNPNSRVHIVGNRAFLISLYLIKSGMEVTFDYSTTSTDTTDIWSMNCRCGVYGCRKVISGYQYLDATTQQKYEALDAVPKYVKDSIK